MVIFEEQLEKVGAARPRTIQGAEEITEVYEFLSEICPYYFTMEKWIEKQSEEKLQESRKKQRIVIEKALSKWGY